MRTVDTHLLEDKMDEAVTHYMNSHNPNEPVHIDSNGIPMTVQDDGAGRVTIMHQQTYTTQMCRQVSVTEQVGDGPWGEELLEGPIAAIVAHLQNSRHHPTTHHKVSQVRTDAVDTSVILDSTMRFNGQSLEQQSEPIVVQLPPMQTLPPLQDMKRCDTVWFTDKNKKQEEQGLVVEGGRCTELGGKQPSRKSLPHKKRISRKLKRPHGNTTPQQEQLVVINCNGASGAEHEQILPDNYVAVPHAAHIPHEVRPVLVCVECGEYYGEDQLKFYHHLKGHYEPHHTIIIENPVTDLPIDKMSANCIVDNVATLPDSIVELSLENTVPKTLYQPIEKHILYSTTDKTLSYNSNKVQYSMASMEPVPDEVEKAYRKQRHDPHGRDTHATNTKLEDMGEFSEPEDLMAGIQVCVPETYETPLLPHLTVDNGTVRQEHARHWYSRQGSAGAPSSACDAYCGVCAREPDTPYKLLKEEVLQRILDTEVSDNANFADNMMPDHEVTGHDQDDHNPDHSDQNHAHDDHGQGDHTHNNHGHALSDHSHGNNDHNNGHNESNRHGSHIQDQHHIQNEHIDSLRHSEHSQNSQEHNDNDQELDHSHLTESHSEQWQLHTLHGTDQIEPEPEQNEHSQEHNEHSQEHNEHSQEYNEHSQEHNEHSQEHNELQIREIGDDEPLEYQLSGGRLRAKRFICMKCNRGFVHRNSLIYHLLSHNGKQHKCRDCNKAFLTTGALKIHSRMHNNVRPYKCELCGRQFRQWSDLKYHRNSLHSDKKHFKCEYCGKEFARKYSLSLHIKVHTGEKNFKCEVCNKSFRCSSYKIAHMRTHTDDRPYKCTECGKGFRSTFDLRRHATTHDKHRATLLHKHKLDDKHKHKLDDKHKLTTIDTQAGKVQFESEEIEIIPKYELVPEEPPQKKTKQVALASTTRQAVLLKKPSKPKKSKKGAPNVTVQSRDVFKTNDDIVYSKDVYDNKAEFKLKHVYDDKIPVLFKEEQTRELAILRPLGSHRVGSVEEKVPYRTENTDGKMQVYTNVEKGMASQVLGDMREVRHDLPEGESGFIERLTAMYSISTG